jgi:hypothetical protein
MTPQTPKIRTGQGKGEQKDAAQRRSEQKDAISMQSCLKLWDGGADNYIECDSPTDRAAPHQPSH